MADFHRSEFDKNYKQKCQDIVNLCIAEDEKTKQFINPQTEHPFKRLPDPANSLYFVNNYQYPNASTAAVVPQNSQLYFRTNSYENQMMKAADFERNYFHQPFISMQNFGPFPNNTGKNLYDPVARNENNPTPTQQSNIGPHIYSVGASVATNSNYNGSYYVPSACSTPSPNSGSNQVYFAKNFYKKTNNYNRKYPRYIPPRKHETNLDFDVTDITPEMLQIKIKSETKSNFLTLVSQFRRLSLYAMEMCRERMSLDNMITGYKSVNNYYLPTVISNISNHIKVIRQSLGYEFYEIWKLIDSIEIVKYQVDNECKVREVFQNNLCEFDKFENIKIKQKNGEILLSNEKIFNLETIVGSLIDCVRYYTIYLNVLQFKYNKKMQSDCHKKPDDSVNLEIEKNTENILEYFDLVLSDDRQPPQQQEQQSERRCSTRRNVGF